MIDPECFDRGGERTRIELDTVRADVFRQSDLLERRIHEETHAGAQALVAGDLLCKGRIVAGQVEAVIGRQLIVVVRHQGRLMRVGGLDQRVESGIAVVAWSGERIAFDVEFNTRIAP